MHHRGRGADDRLVLSNAKYREIYPLISDILAPGVSFEEMMHAAVARGRFKDAEGRVEEWVAERVHRHRSQVEPVERLLGDGRWYRISQRTTGSGSIVQRAYPSEPGLTTCWVCGCHRRNVRLMFRHAQPLEVRPPDVPRRLRGALSR